MPKERNKRKSRSCSPARRRERKRSRSNSRHKEKSRINNENKSTIKEETNTPVQFKPNFELSGKLAEETNTINGVIVHYNEPPESRIPDKKWRLYIFKDTKQIDIPIDHPSSSKQHAVLQYREVTDDTKNKIIKPYIIDLGSTNGTYLNSIKVPVTRYVELKEKDVFKFGLSEREWVILKE